MSNYTKTVDFAAKDTLPSGDSGKIIKGTEFETEFDNISTAIATKADSAAPTFTGTSVFTNLDINGTVQADGAVTVGVDDTGYDVKFFGATAGKSLLWDESADTLIVTGTTTLVGTANLDAVDVDGDMTFGDNNKAIFGAGSDLEIYHTATGNHSIIEETGGGNLVVRTNGSHIEFDKGSTEYMARMIPDGAVELYYDSALKLATSASGISVTGSVTADGLVVDAGAGFTGSISTANNTSNVSLAVTGNRSAGTASSGTDVFIGSAQARSAGRDVLQVINSTAKVASFDAGGDISFYEDTGTTPKLFWDASAESLGIGTASPSAEIDVQNINSPQIRITDTGGNVTTKLMSDTTVGFVGTQTNHPLSFLVNNLETMRIDASGNLLVGTTSARTGTNSLTFEPLNSYFMMRAAGTGTISQVAFVRDTAGTPVQVGDIATTGTATAYNTSSDQRLKANITDANDAGDKIDAIKVRQYDWKADGSHQDYGMVAQELMTVAPEAVSGDPESDEMMGVDYSKLVPMMLKEIQSLRARVAALES